MAENVSATSQRVQIELPLQQHQKLWEDLGVEWVRKPNQESFTALGKLPQGWSVRKSSSDFDKRNFTVLDANNTPKVVVRMKLAFYDQWARVSVLSEEKAAEMKAAYEQKSDLDVEFERLLEDYSSTYRFTEGCGAQFQADLDEKWEKLQSFAKAHPEFTDRVPSKRKVYDDGTGGIATGISRMAILEGKWPM